MANVFKLVIFVFDYRHNKKLMAKHHIKARSDASGSTNARNANENGCRVIRGQMQVKNALNVTSVSIHTNRYIILPTNTAYTALCAD